MHGELGFFCPYRLCHCNAEWDAFALAGFSAQPVDFARGQKALSALSICGLSGPEMPFASHHNCAIPEGDPVCLLIIVHLAFGNHVAYLTAFIKQGIAHADCAHGGIAIRRGQAGGQGKLLAVFLPDFDVGGIELPVAVLLDYAKQVADDLFLPRKQIKRLSCPDALCVLERLDEQHRTVCAVLVIMRSRQHEGRRLVLVFFSFLHLHALPQQ